MVRERIAPGTVGAVGVVPLGYRVGDDSETEGVIPRPVTDGGEELDYPRGMRVGQPVKIQGPGGIEEWVPTRWRGLARVAHLDGTVQMVRRWRQTKGAVEVATRQTGLESLARRRGEAEQIAQAATASADGDTTTTVAGLVAQALVSPGVVKLKPKTRQDYRYAAERVTDHAIGAMLPRDVDVKAVRGFLGDTAAKYGGGGAKHARVMLSKALDLATEDRALQTPMNVSLAVRDAIPKVRMRETGLDPKRAPTDAEMVTLITALDADPEAGRMKPGERAKSKHGQAGTAVNGKDVADMVAFLFATGARIGEASAVRWSDLDLDAKTVAVTGTVTTLNGVGTVRQEATKTGTGRVVPLADSLVERLRDRAEFFDVDLDARPELPVFGSPQYQERYRDQRNLSRSVASLFDKHGVTWGRGHLGRKYRVTSLVERGVPIHKAADVVGHASIATTMKYLGTGRGIDPDVRANL